MANGRARTRGRDSDWGCLLAAVLGFVALVGGCGLVFQAAADDLAGVLDFEFLGPGTFDCLGAGLGPPHVSPVDLGPHGAAPRWNARLAVPATSPPAVGAGFVFVRTQQGVVALDAATGAIAWSVDLAGRPLLGIDFAPVVDGDTVFVTGWDGVVHALDAATGAPRWSTPLPGAVATTTTTTGIGAPLVPGPDPFELPSGGAPLLVGADSVYVGAVDLVALDRDRGAVRWIAPIGNRTFQGYSTPVRRGDVIVGAGAGDVRAFDVASGAPRWSTTLGSGDTSGYASPRVAVAPAGLVVTGGQGDRVEILDPATGSVLRSVASGPFGSFGSVPGIAGDLAYVRADTLDALDPATGGVVRHTTTLGPTDFDFNPPTVTDALVITPGGDGRLHAVDRADGREHWAIGRYRPGRCKTGSAPLPPATTATEMIVVSGDRHVIAFDRADIP